MKANAASWRARMTRMLLWVSVVAWGILMGGKLFDHVVLVGAWSASPPESLSLLPYGPRFPVDTGDYFFPSSVALLVCSFGLFVSGWRTPLRYRLSLFLPPLMLPSVDTSNPAIYRHRKTGHLGPAVETA